MKFKVEVIERYKYCLEIEAENKSEASIKLQHEYFGITNENDFKFVADMNTFEDVKFKISEV